MSNTSTLQGRGGASVRPAPPPRRRTGALDGWAQRDYCARMVRLHAYLSYADAPAALSWMEAVGFAVVHRELGDDGALVHTEVRWGEAGLMVSGSDEGHERPRLLGSSTGQGPYLLLARPAGVDAWHARAVAAGGTSVIPPEDTQWGSRRARVLDPGGIEWSVGTYAPGGTR